MVIHVLGTGCPKCGELERRVLEATTEMQLKADVVKVTDLRKIMEYGVMLTPALAINNEVKVSGRLPNQAEIKRWIQEAAL